MYQGITPNVFATYYPNAAAWINATVMTLATDTPGIDVVAHENASTTGHGTITGEVLEGNKSHKTQGPGDPLKGINVSLVKNASGIPIKSTITDSSGKFNFDNVPEGDYHLWVDVTGVPVDTSILTKKLTITPTDTVINNIIIVYDSSLISLSTKVSVQELINDFGFIIVKIYPNPTTGTFTLALENVKDEKVQVKIMNVLGERVYSSNPQISKSLNLQIDLSALPAGIYFLQVNIGEEIVNRKLVLEK